MEEVKDLWKRNYLYGVKGNHCIVEDSLIRGIIVIIIIIIVVVIIIIIIVIKTTFFAQSVQIGRQFML